MKKMIIGILLPVFFTIFIFGCDTQQKTTTDNSMVSGSQSTEAVSPGPSGEQGIKFTYFCRGFTAVDNVNLQDFEQMEGVHVIQTQDAWGDFMGKYCPGISYAVAVDFSKESLIAAIYMGAKPTYAQSNDIQKISIVNNQVEIQNAFSDAAPIYALNTAGITNFYFNIVKVDKGDLPSAVNDVYQN